MRKGVSGIGHVRGRIIDQTELAMDLDEQHDPRITAHAATVELGLHNAFANRAELNGCTSFVAGTFCHHLLLFRWE